MFLLRAGTTVKKMSAEVEKKDKKKKDKTINVMNWVKQTI